MTIPIPELLRRAADIIEKLDAEEPETRQDGKGQLHDRILDESPTFLRQLAASLEAMALTQSYWIACARAWEANEGRVINETGHAVTNAEHLGALADAAAERTAEVVAEAEHLRGLLG